MTVPDPSFTVTDVRQNVGARRLVEAMDCATQRNSEMTMKDFEDYYNGTNREKLLNVISLEVSFTKLESQVVAPKVVRQVDFVDNVWPRHLKEQQTEVRKEHFLLFIFFWNVQTVQFGGIWKY